MKSLDTQREAETLIRWDETGEDATLWTASARVRREWQSWGFEVRPTAGGGWGGRKSPPIASPIGSSRPPRLPPVRRLHAPSRAETAKKARNP
jgi:hypothetical protein